MSLSIPEPAVSRKTLTRTAGSLWLLVGVFLLVRGLGWLSHASVNHWLLAAAGLLLGLLKSHFVLSKIVRRNLDRIYSLSPHKEKICVFAFQAIQSYLIVIVMVTLGILLRSLSIAPDWLVLIYFTIGSALILSGLRYFAGPRDGIENVK
ncbi:MAG: hypothetical protein OEW00_02965 [candidate division Zixibacteria bacterium]|nr:hypothetical protein [candidate division Zixibacteria bacterium]